MSEATTLLSSSPCHGHGDVLTVSVRVGDLLNWRDGLHIQDCFPYLSTDEREWLMTGYCPRCWEEMFPEEEEEEDDEWTDGDLDELFKPYGYTLLDPESDDPSYDSDYYVDRDCD